MSQSRKLPPMVSPGFPYVPTARFRADSHAIERLPMLERTGNLPAMLPI